MLDIAPSRQKKYSDLYQGHAIFEVMIYMITGMTVTTEATIMQRGQYPISISARLCQLCHSSIQPLLSGKFGIHDMELSGVPSLEATCNSVIQIVVYLGLHGGSSHMKSSKVEDRLAGKEATRLGAGSV